MPQNNYHSTVGFCFCQSRNTGFYYPYYLYVIVIIFLTVYKCNFRRVIVRFKRRREKKNVLVNQKTSDVTIILKMTTRTHVLHDDVSIFNSPERYDRIAFKVEM